MQMVLFLVCLIPQVKPSTTRFQAVGSSDPFTYELLFYTAYPHFTFVWPCIVTSLILIKPTDALISQIYFCQEILHVSGSSSTHHQKFSTTFSTGICHTVLMMAFKPDFPCWKAAIKPAWHIPVSNVQWNTSDDGQRNRPKYVEFLDKNTFQKFIKKVLFPILCEK